MEFTEIMKHWRRMCEHYTTDDAASCCNGCPMDGRGCGAIYENGNAEPEIIEREVQRWAAEHPEPVYPTWFEWLEKVGVAGRAYQLEPYFSGDKEILFRTAAFTPKAFDPISADIAHKLGMEPIQKEDA